MTRDWFHRSMVSLAATLAAGIVTVHVGPAAARPPQSPVSIACKTQPGAARTARLQCEVAADPAEISELYVTSSIQASEPIQQAQTVLRRLNVPAVAMSAVESLPSKQLFVDKLAPGVYAHVINIEAKLRKLPGEPLLTDRYVEYFKIADGQLTMISSAEFTDGVVPKEQYVRPDGSVSIEYRGAAVDAGRSRNSALGAIHATGPIPDAQPSNTPDR